MFPILFLFLFIISNLLIFAQQTGKEPRLMKPTHTFIGKDLSSEVSAFLKSQIKQLQANYVTLSLNYQKNSPIGKHLAYKQLYLNIPIYSAGIKVNLNKNNAIVSVYDNTIYFTKSVGNEVFNKDKIEGIVLEISKGKISQSELDWYLKDSILHLARSIITVGDKLGGVTEFIMDVETGEELLRNRLERHFSRHLLKDTTVMGNVFIPDPLTSARVPYGGDYIDNNDADNLVLTNQLKDVPLRNIYYNETTQLFWLQGPYVTIMDDYAPWRSGDSSVINKFKFTRSHPQFEAVMCYYHIDTFQRYIQYLGFNDLWRKPLRVDPHGDFTDNSTFYPDGNNSYLTFGVGGIDDAEDADVIIHEYAHALSDEASPGANAGNEERTGLDEGFGDYFAASYSRRINDYNWQKVFTWDGNAGFTGRSVATSKLYSPNRGKYEYAEIWASALMMCWESIGYEKLDMIVLSTLYRTFQNMTLKQGAMEILLADTLLFEGQHNSCLMNAFCYYGILKDSLRCMTAIDNKALFNSSVKCYPNPSKSKIFIEIKYENSIENYQINLFDLTGKLIKQLETTDNQIVMDIENLPEGLYGLQVIDLHSGLSLLKKVLIVK